MAGLLSGLGQAAPPTPLQPTPTLAQPPPAAPTPPAPAAPGVPVAPSPPSRRSSSEDDVRPSDDRPLIKLSVNLLRTFNLINQRYYAQKKKRQGDSSTQQKEKKQRHNNMRDDEDYNYIIEAPGEVLHGRYKIETQLGKGSFGRVVKCWDSKEKVHVAVKIVKSKQPFFVQAQIEIDLLTALQEETEERNIVRLKDTFVHHSHQCLVFELLSLNLFDLLQSTNFRGVSLNLISKFARQLLLTLRYLATKASERGHGVIHCDIKPENILLRSAKRSAIKLIDFGSGCYAHDKMYSYIQSRYYRAPEVLLGLEYGTPIDMFSLACTLFEVHVGKPLFDGANEAEQVVRHVEILGVPPAEMIKKSRKGKRYFQKDTDGKWQLKPQYVPRTERSVRVAMGDKFSKDKEECLAFEQLLKAMLDYDPKIRIQPEVALKHPFFALFVDPPATVSVRAGAAARATATAATATARLSSAFVRPSIVTASTHMVVAAAAAAAPAASTRTSSSLLSLPTRVRPHSHPNLPAVKYFPQWRGRAAAAVVGAQPELVPMVAAATAFSSSSSSSSSSSNDLPLADLSCVTTAAVAAPQLLLASSLGATTAAASVVEHPLATSSCSSSSDSRPGGDGVGVGGGVPLPVLTLARATRSSTRTTHAGSGGGGGGGGAIGAPFVPPAAKRLRKDSAIPPMHESARPCLATVHHGKSPVTEKNESPPRPLHAEAKSPTTTTTAGGCVLLRRSTRRKRPPAATAAVILSGPRVVLRRVAIVGAAAAAVPRTVVNAGARESRR